MRHISSDRHGSIQISALRETAKRQGITGEVAGSVHADVGAHLETDEGKEERRFTHVDGIINDDLYNHTYGIIDLAAATATYYQVPAWLETNADPDEAAPAEPLHVEQL